MSVFTHFKNGRNYRLLFTAVNRVTNPGEIAIVILDNVLTAVNKAKAEDVILYAEECSSVFTERIGLLSVYVCLADGKVWARRHAEFWGDVDNDGVVTPRFIPTSASKILA